MVDRPTVEVYERRARDWAAARSPEPGLLAAAGELRRSAGVAIGRTATGGAGVVADLGCGTGNYLAALGGPTVAVDASAAMLSLARAAAPGVAAVRADIGRLPFRAGSLVGAWAVRSYVHLARSAVPLALAELHRALHADAALHLLVFRGDADFGPLPADDFPGRRFSGWPPGQLADVVEGAGFSVTALDAGPADGADIVVRAVRQATLPDFVGPGMEVLFCGLNPSVHAAVSGVPYAGPGNRFWPAVRAAGLLEVARDPWHALRACRVGMTDLVKRATPRAGDVGAAEFHAGLARVERLVAWLRPRALCFVGLTGYRTAVQRGAPVGWQAQLFAGAPAYVMPSTSGLNARTSLAELTDHVRAVRSGAGKRRPTR